MSRLVIVKIVVELVGDGGELFEEVVKILFAAGPAWLRKEVLDGVHASVEELDEDKDAVGRNVRGIAELLDLGLGKCPACGSAGNASVMTKQSVARPRSIALVQEDLREQFVLYAIELLER